MCSGGETGRNRHDSCKNFGFYAKICPDIFPFPGTISSPLYIRSADLSLSSPINTKVTFTVWMADQGIFEMGRGKKTGVPWWDHPMYHGSPLRLPCLNSPDIPVRVRKVGEGTLSLHKNFLTCALSPNSSSFHKFRPIHPIFTCGEVEMCTLLNLAYQEYDR